MLVVALWILAARPVPCLSQVPPPAPSPPTNAMPAAAAAVAPAEKKPSWDQSVALGFTLNKGNTDNLLLAFDYRAIYRVAHQEVGLGLTASYGEDNGKKNVDQLRAVAQYNWIFRERFYGYARAEGLHDEIADVDYRFSLSPGAGYYFVKNPNTKLSAELGPGYTIERKGGIDRDFVTLRAGERFEHKFNDKTRVWQTIEMVPEVKDFSHYIATFEVGLETTLTKMLSLRLTLRDSYNTNPAAGHEENDFRFITSLAVKF